jgi:hypothetical protein
MRAAYPAISYRGMGFPAHLRIGKDAESPYPTVVIVTNYFRFFGVNSLIFQSVEFDRRTPSISSKLIGWSLSWLGTLPFAFQDGDNHTNNE